MHLPRPILTAIATASLLSATVLASAAPALAEAPVGAKLTLAAPAAVRAGRTFTVRGTASVAVSPGETVTVALERKTSSGWTVESTVGVAVCSLRQFSAVVDAPQRGHWRASAALPGTTSHTSASVSDPFKSVGSKVVALTFDDGPWPMSTAKILSALKKGDAQATFFTLGSQVKGRASLVRREIAEGNSVGVHTWNHALMTRRSASANKADLKRCVRAVSSACGVTPVWFRPPYGSTNSRVKKAAAAVGLKQVIWSVDTLDWKYRTQSSVVPRAVRSARNGNIVLMHDGGGPRGATAAAVPVIIKRLRAKGFDFVTLDEMAALGYRVR